MLSPSHPIVFFFFIILPSIFSQDEIYVSRRLGQTVELSCDIKKMDRNIEVMWHRPNEAYLIKVDHDGTKKNEIYDTTPFELDPLTSAFKIMNLTEDTAFDYNCEKTVKNQKTVIKYKITAYDPVECVYPQQQDLEEDKVYNFNASLVFSGITPKYSSTIGDRIVKSGENDDISVLMKWVFYKAVSDDDGKNLTMKYILGENKEICSRKLSVLHPPKQVKIISDEAVERGASISCTSNGNPKANLELKNGDESLAKGLAKVIYIIPQDTEMVNLTIQCNAKNKFTKDAGVFDTKTVSIIAKAFVKGSATLERCSGWFVMAIIIITTLLHPNH